MEFLNLKPTTKKYDGKTYRLLSIEYGVHSKNAMVKGAKKYNKHVRVQKLSSLRDGICYRIWVNGRKRR